MPKRKLSALLCNKCSVQFDTADRAPIIGTCGHTVCATCVKGLAKRCPCCLLNTFAKRTSNILAVELLNELENSQTTPPSPEDCQHCSEKVADDAAWVCVTCLFKGGRGTAAQVLDEAKLGRSCEPCAKVSRRHSHVGRKLTDVTTTLISKQMKLDEQMRVDEKFYNKQLKAAQKAITTSLNDFSELIKGMRKINRSRNGLNYVKQKVEDCCKSATKELNKAIHVTWSAEEQLQGYIGVMKTLMADMVPFQMEDMQIADLVVLPSPDIAQRPRLPAVAHKPFDYFLTENKKRHEDAAKVRQLTTKEVAEQEWNQLADKSKFAKLAADDSIRYCRQMAQYFAQ